jgi:hypothetical protein
MEEVLRAGHGRELVGGAEKTRGIIRLALYFQGLFVYTSRESLRGMAPAWSAFPSAA